MPILVDEHVPRVVRTALVSSGYHTKQAAEQFGQETIDRELLEWCCDNDWVLLTNDKKDFNEIATGASHAGVFIYVDQL